MSPPRLQSHEDLFLRAPIGLGQISATGELLQTNLRMAEYLGRDPGALRGHRLPELLATPESGRRTGVAGAPAGAAGRQHPSGRRGIRGDGGRHPPPPDRGAAQDPA